MDAALRGPCPHCGYRAPGGSALDFGDEDEEHEPNFSDEEREQAPSEPAATSSFQLDLVEEPDEERPPAASDQRAGPAGGAVQRCFACGAVFLGRPGQACPKCAATQTGPYGGPAPAAQAAAPAAAPAGQATCSDCGASFKGGPGDFCPMCGSRNTGAPATGAASPPGTVRCAGCGMVFDLRLGTNCPKCGAPAPAVAAASAVPAGAARSPILRCPACGVAFMGRPGDPCPKCQTPAGERTGLPWQDRANRGISVLGAIWKTIVAVHQAPGEAFAELKPARGLAEPISYQIWLCAGILLLTAAVSLAFQVVGMQLLNLPLMGGGAMPVSPLIATLLNAVAGLVAIGFLIAWDLFAAWAAGRLAVAFGGERASHADTYCVFAYGVTSARVWWLLPGCGAIIGFVWALVIGSAGLAAVHRTTAGRTFWALAIVVFLGALVWGPLAVVRQLLITLLTRMLS